MAATTQVTSVPKFESLLETQRAYFDSGKTRSVAVRLNALEKLEAGLKRHQAELLEAARVDLGKCPTEGFLSELFLTLQELAHTRQHLGAWLRPRPVPTPVPLQPASSEVLLEPKGVCLLIGPWNYPLLLVFTPLIAALAAGNTAIIKTSELAPATSQAVAKLVQDCFEPEYVSVVEGNIETSQALLALRFDHIFFTGGAATGRIVMEKAARHLTPVTLELGGKSPAFVTKNANLDWAAKRIVWGKCLNAGQTCVAPDYVLVDRTVAPAFIEKLKHYIEVQYGKDVQRSPDYGRIVNAHHLQRLQSYLTGTNVVFGGKSEPAERFLEPTLVLDPELDSPLMTEEIFGPILPIIQVDNVEAALRVTLARPKPLAMYIFSTNSSETEQLLSRQSSGGAAINEVVMQMGNPSLPFGGVGSSGFGAYHGQVGLETFSHQRAVLHRSWPIEFALLKPPYAGKLKLLRPLIGLMLRVFY